MKIFLSLIYGLQVFFFIFEAIDSFDLYLDSTRSIFVLIICALTIIYYGFCIHTLWFKEKYQSMDSIELTSQGPVIGFSFPLIFLNYSLIEYMRDVKRVDLTRSRPFKKNDNCHVEQKNETHVR